MRANPATSWLNRIAFTLFFASMAVSVSAQPPTGNQPTLETILIPGTTVWVTEGNGREEKTRIVGLSGDIVTITSGNDVRRLRTNDVARVRVRHSDSVLNGALIGAGAAVASGLALCRLTEPWDICNNPGPLVRIGAVGAGIGAAVDALIRGRKTVYEAGPTSTRLHATPIVGPEVAGLQLSVSF